MNRRNLSLLLSTLLLIVFNHNYSMQTTGPIIKLTDNSTHNIPFSTAFLSNTIHLQHLLQKKLGVDHTKPLPIFNTEKEHITLFRDAAPHLTDNTFIPFFSDLTLEQQKDLISACGKDKLDSPHMTALVAQAYIPHAIVQKHILPYLEKDHIINYMRCAMAALSIPLPMPSLSYDYFNPILICAQNGNIHRISSSFDAHKTSLTTNNPSHQISTIDKNRVIFVHKKTDTGEYHVFSTLNEQGYHENYIIWRTNPQEPFKETSFSGGEILIAVCSPDGYYMAVRLSESTENCILLCLDPSADEIITKKIILPDSLPSTTKMHFNSTSTAFFCFSFDDENQEISQLLAYDILNNQEYLTHFTSVYVQPSFNHDNSRMMAWEVLSDENKLHIWNIKNIADISTIKIIDIHNNYCLRNIQYGNFSNNAAVRFNNGNVLLVKENSLGEIQLSHLINPHKDNKKITLGTLLFTSDDKILIDHCQTKVVNQNKKEQRVTVWDAEFEKYIVHDTNHRSPALPEIILNETENEFLVSVVEDEAWQHYTLCTPSEQATCQWVNDNENLFMIYMLRRLMHAHKQKDEIIPEHQAIVGETMLLIPSPQQTFVCYYLYKTRLQLMQLDIHERANSLKEQCVAFFNKCAAFFKR